MAKHYLSTFFMTTSPSFVSLSLCTIVAVFNWPIDKHCRIDMSEVLINITTPLRFDTLYDEVLPPEDYTLATAVCPERTSCFSYLLLSSFVHESSHLQCSLFKKNKIKSYIHALDFRL
jgi:hypothetical protein